MAQNTKRDIIIEEIAKEHCFVETLKERGRGSLDFHDIGVVGLRKALEAAFEAGRLSQ